MKGKITVLFYFIFLFGCNNNNINELCYYYENGDIKERFLYDSKNDTTTYTFYSYYQNGIIESIIPYIKGKVNGTVKLYNKKGELDLIKTYKNDRLYGIYTKFNHKNPMIVQQILFINDEQLIKIDKGNAVSGGKEVIGMTYFYVNKGDTSFQPIGSLSYDINDHVRRQKSCSYFETFAADTINYDEAYKMKIVSHIGIMEGHNIELYLGEINEDFKFVDSTNVKVFRSEDNTLEINLSQSDYLLGNNLLTGKIRVFNNGEDITNQYMIDPIDNIPYIFFKQFFVKSEQ